MSYIIFIDNKVDITHFLFILTYVGFVILESLEVLLLYYDIYLILFQNLELKSIFSAKVSKNSLSDKIHFMKTTI